MLQGLTAIYRSGSHLLIQHMFIVPLGENVECTPLCNTGFTERSAQLSKCFKWDSEEKTNEFHDFSSLLDNKTTVFYVGIFIISLGLFVELSFYISVTSLILLIPLDTHD